MAGALNVPVPLLLDEAVDHGTLEIPAALNDEESLALDLFRRISKPRQRAAILRMLEDLVRVAEGKQ